MSANKSPNRSSRDWIRISKFAPHQLAQLVTLQVQRAHHAADDFIEQNSSELAKVAMISGAVATAAILLRRKAWKAFWSRTSATRLQVHLWHVSMFWRHLASDNIDLSLHSQVQNFQYICW